MNRRKFIVQGAATVAIAALPKALYAKKVFSPSAYKSLETGDPTKYGLGIDHGAVQNFSAAADAEKLITLKVQTPLSAGAAELKTSEFQYIMSASKKMDTKTADGGVMYEVSAKMDKTLSGDYSLPKDLKKNLKLHIIPLTGAQILDRKGKDMIFFTYVVVSSSTGQGCFLTTACVQHKGLPDDCAELTALRSLRNDFMSKRPADAWLIEEYKKIGPYIVSRINQCSNSDEIYRYMYQYMIVPSAALVQAGRCSEAVELYKLFTQALLAQYC